MLGVQLCVRAGDEKALAIRGQLLLEIHYMQMRRAVAQARGEFEYDRALAKRAFLIHRRLESESDEDLRRNLAVSSPAYLSCCCLIAFAWAPAAKLIHTAVSLQQSLHSWLCVGLPCIHILVARNAGGQSCVWLRTAAGGVNEVFGILVVRCWSSGIEKVLQMLKQKCAGCRGMGRRCRCIA